MDQIQIRFACKFRLIVQIHLEHKLNWIAQIQMPCGCKVDLDVSSSQIQIQCYSNFWSRSRIILNWTLRIQIQDQYGHKLDLGELLQLFSFERKIPVICLCPNLSICSKYFVSEKFCPLNKTCNVSVAFPGASGSVRPTSLRGSGND